MGKKLQIHSSTAEFEKYRIIQDKLFQSDFDRWDMGNTLDFDKEE